jgi:hypothetical protein
MRNIMSRHPAKLKSDTRSKFDSQSALSKSAVPNKNHRFTLDMIDWKKSVLYKNVIGEVDEKMTWNRIDDLLKHDECDHLLKLIAVFKSKKVLFTGDELSMVQHRAVKRAYQTIEYLHKELLQEPFYLLEYEKMITKDPYVVRVAPKGFSREHAKIFTLERLLNRIQDLQLLKRETRHFLGSVH